MNVTVIIHSKKFYNIARIEYSTNSGIYITEHTMTDLLVW